MKGLVNLGNTCYFNSMLQCLLNCNPFVNYFSELDYHGDDQVVKNIKSLVERYWTDEQNVIRPVNALKHLQQWCDQFQGYNQQDAHEAYLCFIEGIHKALIGQELVPRYHKLIKDQEAVKQWDQEKPSIITEMFMGQLKVTVDDTHYETFRSLELSPTYDTSVDALVFDYFKKETTSDSDMVIGRRLNYPPIVLALSIKQFFRKYTIDIKKKLDLSWYVDEPFKKVKYKLYGVILHGGDRHGGHYISMTKWNGQWYENNDSRVRKVNFEDIRTNSIYMLFYLMDNNSFSLMSS